MSLTAIADAVAADLAAATLVVNALSVQRVYLPARALDDAAGPARMTVVGVGETITRQSRGISLIDYSIQVAVQQKLDSEAQNEPDSLVALTEQIADYFWDRALTGRPERLVAAAVLAWSPEHMDKHRQFTSIATLTFRGGR